MFRKYHYLNTTLSNSSKCYIATINNQPVGFMAVLHFPHPKSKNIKKIHRLVVLPDYQGIGIGNRLLENVGEIYLKQGYRYTITTSTPSLIHYLSKSDKWTLLNQGRKQPHGGLRTGLFGSFNRLTTSWEMKNIV